MDHNKFDYDQDILNPVVDFFNKYNLNKTNNNSNSNNKEETKNEKDLEEDLILPNYLFEIPKNMKELYYTIFND